MDKDKKVMSDEELEQVSGGTDKYSWFNNQQATGPQVQCPKCGQFFSQADYNFHALYCSSHSNAQMMSQQQPQIYQHVEKKEERHGSFRLYY